jgi:hypothetical protein
MAIVAHDAGAANHLIAWINTGLLDATRTQISFEGPALSSYQNTNPSFKNLSLENALNDVDLLISGTGWSSDIEHQSRVMAKNHGIKSIAVIDHWVNYPQRFIRNGIEQLPDEIWVVDEYAENIAKKTFPSICVQRQHNDFINHQLNEISYFKKDTHQIKTHLLFVMEPIRKDWGGKEIPGEMQAFEYMLEHSDLLTDKNIHQQKLKIVIKPHPSDPRGKYDHWLKKFQTLDVKVNESDSLAKLIAWSDIVAGCETYAMVVALSSGKKVISVLPPIAPPCCLPHKDIMHLSEMVAP